MLSDVFVELTEVFLAVFDENIFLQLYRKDEAREKMAWKSFTRVLGINSHLRELRYAKLTQSLSSVLPFIPAVDSSLL